MVLKQQRLRWQEWEVISPSVRSTRRAPLSPSHQKQPATDIGKAIGNLAKDASHARYAK
jgi:hypothetical protein